MLSIHNNFSAGAQNVTGDYAMDLIRNDVKNKNGGDSWGTFVQKDIKTEVFHYAYGE